VPLLLIAYDGSDPARAAVRAAASLAPGADAIVAAVDPDRHPHGDGPAEAGAALARELGLRAEARALANRHVADALASLAHEVDADLVACGSRGHGGLKRAALGSVSSALLHGLHRPLLVAREAGPGEGPAVIAYDASETARHAIRRAAPVLGRGREAIVVTAWEPSPPLVSGSPISDVDLMPVVDEMDDVLERAAQEDAEAGAELAREAGLDARPKARLATGGVWRAVDEFAREQGAALIVCGSHGRRGLAAAIMGSVSTALVHHAELPVLVVRGTAE